MPFDLVLAGAALIAGLVAAFTGFGIGTLLTPILALQVDARLAVAAVSVPHFIATAMRFWLLRRHVDRHVLWSFGLTSAAGGLTGALLQVATRSSVLLGIMGALLLVAAAGEFTGVARRLQFRGALAWLAGGVSGLLGGLVGNQGGIRAAALMGLHLQREAFVATATATGLLVDAARMPVYLWTQGGAIAEVGGWLVLITAGVVAGTLVGHRMLRRFPLHAFRRLVAVVFAVLGVAMLARAFDVSLWAFWRVGP